MTLVSVFAVRFFLVKRFFFVKNKGNFVIEKQFCKNHENVIDFLFRKLNLLFRFTCEIKNLL